jgi:hypothetical protein
MDCWDSRAPFDYSNLSERALAQQVVAALGSEGFGASIGRKYLNFRRMQSAFTFSPECCSESQRNGVQLQTGIAFTFDRIPHS